MDVVDLTDIPYVFKNQEVDHSESKWEKPLLFALVIIGILGLGAAGTGLASFGAQAPQNWWAAGALSNLSQVDAIIMMSAGGGVVLVSMIIGGLIKAKPREESSPGNQAINKQLLLQSKRLLSSLQENQWTFDRKDNGNYDLVQKLGNQLIFKKRDLRPGQLKNKWLERENFVHTSILPTDPEIPPDEMLQILKFPKTYTFARQMNKNYALVVRHPSPNDVYPHQEGIFIEESDILPKDLSWQPGYSGYNFTANPKDKIK